MLKTAHAHVYNTYKVCHSSSHTHMYTRKHPETCIHKHTQYLPPDWSLSAFLTLLENAETVENYEIH